LKLIPSFVIIQTNLKDIFIGVNLFNDADFFSAHDFFEEMWVESNREDRLFFQGLVQILVGCYHLICKNYKGALSQFMKGEQKLKNYLPFRKKVDLEKLLLSISSLIDDVGKFPKGAIDRIDLNKIPRIEILN
jgi:predicted metal-dependent hydrolase